MLFLLFFVSVVAIMMFSIKKSETSEGGKKGGKTSEGGKSDGGSGKGETSKLSSKLYSMVQNLKKNSKFTILPNQNFIYQQAISTEDFENKKDLKEYFTLVKGTCMLNFKDHKDLSAVTLQKAVDAVANFVLEKNKDKEKEGWPIGFNLLYIPNETENPLGICIAASSDEEEKLEDYSMEDGSFCFAFALSEELTKQRVLRQYTSILEEDTKTIEIMKKIYRRAV